QKQVVYALRGLTGVPSSPRRSRGQKTGSARRPPPAKKSRRRSAALPIACKANGGSVLLGRAVGASAGRARPDQIPGRPSPLAPPADAPRHCPDRLPELQGTPTPLRRAAL